MSETINIWLLDIRSAIEEINAFLPEERDFFVFEKDLKTQRAIERNLEIIGEAMKRILEEKPNIEISNARRIVDTRNRIIHGYDTVSVETLWGIVQRHLPILESEVNVLLQSDEES